jgi:excisionase family DNA binding protein
MLLTVKGAADYLGVATSTLRRWESEGKLLPQRTEGNHRRYNASQLIRYREKIVSNRYTVAYARVSSSDQKEDLSRQIEGLSNYCMAKGYQFQIIEDLGSGLNCNKKGLRRLIELVCSGDIDRIVINYKDRLIRFGYEIIEQVCELHGVTIEIVNLTEDKTYEQELVEDVLSIITVFSSRLYGSRSHKSKQITLENEKLFKKNNAPSHDMLDQEVSV